MSFAIAIHSLLCTAHAEESPHFSGDSAFSRLQTLVSRGERYYDAPDRQSQIEYLSAELSHQGWNVQIQSFPALEQTSNIQYQLSNIIAIDPKPYSKRIILGSHWDTRLWAEEDPNPFLRKKAIPGANDGSSGVALLLEIAHTLAQNELSNTAVDIIFFDGEEFGRPQKGDYCKGSEYFVQHIEEIYPYQPSGVIIFDMIADRDLILENEGHSISASSALWNSVQKQLFENHVVFSSQKRNIRDDQHPFIKMGIPAILLIDLSYPYWHTHSDTLDKCSPKSLGQIGQSIISWLFENDTSISGR